MLHTIRQGQWGFILFLSLSLFSPFARQVTPTPTSAAVHCVIGKTQTTACFDTPSEALRFASDGTLLLKGATGLTTLTEGDLEMAGILALLYDARDQTGASLAIVGDTCGVSGNMPATWNNRVSSGRTGACGLYLYDGVHQSGNRLFIAAPGIPYVGDLLNNRASSWRIP